MVSKTDIFTIVIANIREDLFDHYVLSSLLVLTHSIPRRTLNEMGYYYCHFTNKDIEEQKDEIT